MRVARVPLVGEVDDHEAAAADTARERLGDAEHGRRRHGRVDRVAALCQRPDRGLRREPLDGRRRAAGARRGWRACRSDRDARAGDDERAGNRNRQEE
jgi:hypothetical protein